MRGYISFKDVAAFSVAVLDNPAANNQTIPAGGPQIMGALEAVKIFEELGSGTFTLEHVTKEALIQQKSQATDPMVESFAALQIALATGFPMEMAEVAKAYDVNLHSVRDYAKQALSVAAPR